MEGNYKSVFKQTMKSIKYFAYVASATLAFASCQKDEQGDALGLGHQPNIYKVQGETVSLNLTATTEEGLRNLTYDVTTSEGLPKLELPEAGSKVPVVVLLRKEGDANTLTYANLEWTVKEDRKTLQYQGDITLASGHFATSDNGKWYIMAAIGAEAEHIGVGSDVSQARLKFSNTALTPAADGKLSIKMPYLMSWTPLTIGSAESAEHKTLKFYPQGSLVRYQVRSNMVDDYKVKAIRVASEGFYSEAYCQINPGSITDASLKGTTVLQRPTGDKTIAGVLPKWQAEKSAVRKRSSIDYTNYSLVPRAMSGMWSFDIWNGYEGQSYGSLAEKTKQSYYYTVYSPSEDISLQSGKESKGYYSWVMPTEHTTHHTAKQPETEVYLEVANASTTGQTMAAIPAHRSQTVIKEGGYYRMYPVLTSDLLISEVMNRMMGSASNPADGAGGAGSVGPGDASGFNLSLLELYNPTLEPINLLDYALARSAADEYKELSQQGVRYYVTNKDQGAGEGPYSNGSTDDLTKAQILPLKILETKNSRTSPYEGTKFASWLGVKGGYDEVYSDGWKYLPRYRLLAGNDPELTNGKLLLEPGKTIVLAMGDWLSLEHEHADWLLDDRDRRFIRETKASLAKAVENKHCQYALMYSDAFEFTYWQGPQASPYETMNNTGVMCLGNGIGFVLIKGLEGGKFAVVDSSFPDPKHYATAENNTAYVTDRNAFWARYKRPNANLLGGISIGHTRRAGNDYANVRPLYYPVGEYVYPYTTLWQPTNVSMWSLGTRSQGVDVNSPLVVARRAW